jgi:hypothetical protein
MMNKEDSLWVKFELFFVFLDLKVILLIVMLFDFYKETVLLADVAKPHLKMLVTELLFATWERAGSGYWLWIIGAVLGDIMIKGILRRLNV